MTPEYISSSVETVVGIPENESTTQNMAADTERGTTSSRRQEYRYDSAMTLARTSSERQRDKPRRSHRNVQNSSANRNPNKGRTRPSGSRYNTITSRDDSSSITRERRQRRRSHIDEDSAHSLSSGEEEAVENHHDVLAAARASLTSPSLISTLTSLTTATNNSGGSSGSNSTVTQASISKNLVPTEAESDPAASISPAVPDPPDVFSFLDNSPEEEDDDIHAEDEDEDPTPHAEVESQWLSDGLYDSSPLSCHISLPIQESMSSSGSSSFHSDEWSERIADNDTDRSTSPEHSVKGEDDAARQEVSTHTDPAASKLASQMLAAQHRQSLHGAFQSFANPQTARANPARPHVPSQALSPRIQQHVQQQPLPRAEQIPITGYDALASKLSSNSAKTSSIKPMYRKFERLNHRLLLHLQDELAELEEQLHMLDNADTQSRSRLDTNGKEIRVFPASRRAAAHAGGELEWHRMDLINRISFKLGQYNQALTSFNKLIKELDSPDLESIKKYRQYLHNERPVIENEAKFLEAPGDLVALSRKSLRASEVESHEVAKPRKVHFGTEIPQKGSSASSHLRIIAAAVAAAVLIPILTFAVIPGFLGRMTVVMLVAMGMAGLLYQSGIAGRDALGNMEWVSCGVIYAGVMVVVAGVTA